MTNRFNDLNKQGFMRRSNRQAKTVVVFESWTPFGVTYSGPNESFAASQVAKYGGEVRKASKRI